MNGIKLNPFIKESKTEVENNSQTRLEKVKEVFVDIACTQMPFLNPDKAKHSPLIWPFMFEDRCAVGVSKKVAEIFYSKIGFIPTFFVATVTRIIVSLLLLHFATLPLYLFVAVYLLYLNVKNLFNPKSNQS